MSKNICDGVRGWGGGQRSSKPLTGDILDTGVEEVAFGSALFCNSEVKKNNTDLRGGNRMMICVALTRQLISLNFTSKQWNNTW